MFQLKQKNRQAQVTLEFTFCFVIALLLIYGCIMAFRWAGLSLANRRIEHEDVLYNGIDERWIGYDQSPAKQVDPNFSKPLPMNMVFNSW